MNKHNLFEKNIINKIINIELFSNLIYLIPSVLVLSLKQWNLGIFGIIVFIVSLTHHLNNCIYFNKRNYIIKENKLLSYIDTILANLLAFYGLYIIYINNKIKPLSSIFVIFFIIFSILALYSLFTSFYYKKNSKKNIDKKNEEFVSDEILYELYNTFWHIFSGICYILTVIWLSF